MRFVLAALTATLFTGFAFAQSPGVTVALKMSPIGSFEAKSSALKGVAKKAGAGITASGITLPLSTLTTGMGLRDNHMKDKYLEVKKYPEAVVTMASGSGGKGKAKLKMRGVEKEVEGTYKVVGAFVEAQFEIKLSDFNITGIRYQGIGVKDTAQVTAVVPLQ